MKTALALGSVVAAVLAMLGSLFGPEALPPVRGSVAADAAPRTLDECFVVLGKELPADTLRRMRAGSEEDMIEYHLSLGMWMRNSWGLWSRGPLYSYFRSIGLEHPDDMSGVILTSFWRYLHDKPLDVTGQVREAQLYWHYAKEPDPKSNPACPTGIGIVLSAGVDGVDGIPRRVHMGKCCLDGRVWAYEADGGWHAPDDRQLAIWNQDPDGRYDPCRKPACPSDEEGRRTKG